MCYALSTLHRGSTFKVTLFGRKHILRSFHLSSADVSVLLGDALIVTTSSDPTAQPQIKGLSDGGGGHIPSNTLVHKQTHSHVYPPPLACLPTYTTPRPNHVLGKLLLSPVYFPFPFLFVIVLKWELGRGQEETVSGWRFLRKNVYVSGSLTLRMGGGRSEGARGVSVCRYWCAGAELL